jgi:hypothetical protein
MTTLVVASNPAADRIKPRERDAVVQALRAGVVPRLGLRHVQVGRSREVDEVIRDIDRIAEGGSAVRFVIGEYGSGKTFFLNLARSAAMERQLVVSHADLSPDRRMHSTGGHARSLYSELMRNMSTRGKPDGGALSVVVERFISAAATAGGDVAQALRTRLAPIQDMVSGYDFNRVIEFYWRSLEDGNEEGKGAALRWLRGEYNTKTEARAALPVRSIIEDAAIYDYLKVMAQFTRLAGFGGFLVVIDEMVNLFKLTNAQARASNYEQILRIINDVLQGSAEGIGFYFGGTPEFLQDSRRGLFSYEALRSRLAENSFARDGLVDLAGPVIRLQTLKPEDIYVLLEKLRHLFAEGDVAKYAVPDEALAAFLEHCSKRVGAAYFTTPRHTIKAFLDLLSVLRQNPGTDWRTLLGKVEIPPDAPPSGGDIDDVTLDDATAPVTPPPAASPDTHGLASFKI